MKPILLIGLLAIAAFCAFGFASTFEPLEGNQQFIWRTTYGIVGVASVVGVARILFAGRGRKD